MRVLIISHNYVHQAPRAKLRALGALPDVDLSVIVPKQWRFQPQGWVRALASEEPEYRLFTLSTLITGKEGLCVYVGLWKKLREIRPDIIHIEHGTASLSLAQILLLGQLGGLKIKTVFFTWVNRNYQLKFPLNIAEQYNIGRSDGAIAGNRDAFDVLGNRGFNKLITVLPLWGIDVSLYSSRDSNAIRQSLGIIDEKFVVGYVGRLVRAKGLLYLIKALAQVPNSALLIAGNGPLREEMAMLAQNLGVDVKFAGVIPHTQVVGYMNAMDVMVLPSLTTPSYDPTFKEQFGHVLIEAMACKTPVIGSDSGEIPNVIGEAGLVFHEGDVDDLTEKLQLLMDNPSLRAELAAKGRQRVLEKYTHQRIAQETYQVYQELLSGE